MKFPHTVTLTVPRQFFHKLSNNKQSTIIAAYNDDRIFDDLSYLCLKMHLENMIIRGV